MNALKDHFEKAVFAIVVAACTVFVYSARKNFGADAREMAGLEACRLRISAELQKKQVSEDYAYSAVAAAKLKYWEAFNASFERGTNRLEGEIPPHVAYPALTRPYVNPIEDPHLPIERHDYAEVLPAKEVRAEGDHGRMFLVFRPPVKSEYMDPVRFVIFRGENERSIDLAKPYGTVELGPEDGPESPAPERGALEGGAASTRHSPSGSDAREPSQIRPRTRQYRTGARQAKDKAAWKTPAEYAGLRVFQDKRVDSKKTYFYQVQLVARMTVPDGTRFEARDATGRVQTVVVHGPKNASPLPGSKPNLLLYAGPLSQVASATTLGNFQIRLAGTSGRIDPLGTPEFRCTKDYKGTFAVRVWVADAQAWKGKTLSVAPGEALKGGIIYKAPGSGEVKACDFDTGYKLVEIKWGEEVRETTVEEIQIGPDGNPVMDERTKQPIKVTRIAIQPVPNEIAVLENLQDRKLEEFPKRADFEKPKAALACFERIAEEQEAEQVVHQKIIKEASETPDGKQKAKANPLSF